LILRHQPAILQRLQARRPDLNRAGRALLAALVSLMPAEGPADRPLYVLGVVQEA
jgi:hypothetical protein